MSSQSSVGISRRSCFGWPGYPPRFFFDLRLGVATIGKSSERTIRRHVKEGSLPPPIKLGNQRLFDPEALRKWPETRAAALFAEWKAKQSAAESGPETEPETTTERVLPQGAAAERGL